jgi:hypothetical protein
MDSIRVSEAPDSGSIPDEATKKSSFFFEVTYSGSLPAGRQGFLTRLQKNHLFFSKLHIQVPCLPAGRDS